VNTGTPPHHPDEEYVVLSCVIVYIRLRIKIYSNSEQVLNGFFVISS